jgi:predicted secreted Zn-dependent protease
MVRMLGLGLLAAAIHPVLAMAEPVTRVHTSYYYVDGSSATVLAAQLDQTGPKDADGKRYAAKTRWDVQWKFNHEQEGETCGIKDGKARRQYPQGALAEIHRGLEAP